MRSSFSHIKQFKARGAAAVYILCLLPVLIAVTFAILDAAKWNFLRDALVQEAATIAKLSAGDLPDTETATVNIRQHAASLQDKFPELENIAVVPFFDNNSSSFAIGVKIDADYTPGLAKLANALIPGMDLKMHISKSVAAQYRPGDYVFIISNAHTLRPKNQNTIFQLYLQNLPAANIFRCSKPYMVDTPNWLSGWDNASSALFFTQACYNPPFLTLKLASIALLDAASDMKNNKTAVIISPGNNSDVISEPFTMLRSISDGFITDAESQTFFSNEYRDSFGLNNTACTLFSKDYLGTNPYKLPVSDTTEEMLNSDYRFCPIQIELNQNIFNRKSLNQSLTLRQAIFWQVAAQQTGNNPADINLPIAISAALQDLLNKTSEQQKYEFSIRGNLATKPKRHVFVFTDTLNGYQPTPEIINTLAVNNIKLTFIIYAHDFLDDGIISENATDFAQLKDSITHMRAEGLNNINAYLASDNTELFGVIMPRVLSETKEIAVKEYGN